MQPQPQIATGSEQNQTVEQKVQKVKELYADAPELGRIALEKGLPNLTREFAAAAGTQSAGRIGARQGKVSELTGIFPFVEGGAKRLRGLLELLEGNFKLADAMGTVHDMRFVFLDNDTKLLMCTAYDGDWDTYINDFGTKIPDIIDLQFGEVEGWPGVRSPNFKDYLVKYQFPAFFWYVASPNLTVVETKRLEKIGPAVEDFLDKVA